MNKHVIDFFKRNPNAAACHLVLDRCFSSAHRANTFRQSIGAKKVSTTTKQEFIDWQAGNGTGKNDGVEVDETPLNS